MVKKEPKTNEQVVENIKSVYEQAQEPTSQFQKLKDKKQGEPEPVKIEPNEVEEITKACPHYYTLKDRYSEYKNFDAEGKNPLPLRIDRIHELSAFEATIAQADLSQGLEVTPTRLIKAFDYSKSNERKAYLIVDKRVVGIDGLGRSTNISTVRTGKFKYPAQFEQDGDGDWHAVHSQLQTIYSIPFDKDKANEFANVGNPFIKKYVVWHPDGMRRGHFTRDEFINLSDDEQISLIEQGKR